MTTSNGSIFRFTGPLWGESTGHRWILLTKVSDAELWWFLWSAPEQTAEQTIESPVIYVHYDVIVMRWFVVDNDKLWSHYIGGKTLFFSKKHICTNITCGGERTDDANLQFELCFNINLVQVMFITKQQIRSLCSYYTISTCLTHILLIQQVTVNCTKVHNASK